MTDDADAARVDRLLRSLDALDNMSTDGPGRVEGADGTGTVRVTLDPAGLAESVSLGDGWRRSVGTGRLAGAVAEAAAAALADRAAVADRRLVDAGLPERLKALDAWVTGETGEPPPGVPTKPTPLPEPSPPTGTTGEILASLDDTRVQGRVRPAATGVSAFGKVTVSLAGNGALTCTADPEWLSRRDDVEVTDAIRAALGHARVELMRLDVR
ncbi:hypothetical protein [Virgisporangium ochraceum]|uniref:YbaB/EbfC DNA-binding family protein n=1 Tax=Virgisporangium ochraceum TaxID=65505 RepID=A0A8J4EAL7_9ACTN|nr:hypothetical protein [Virgisporangium ochraceum]GIJ67543.1 hypothetical protein Voc01_024600 [Virgisporangium ochraceum]